MRNIGFISCLILFLGCNLSTSKNKKSTDLESNHTKAVYLNLNAEKVDFTAFKGKKVLINYWATWCKPCIKEMPALLKAQEILKTHNYVFLLASDEEMTKISSFENDKKYNFTFLKSVSSIESLGIYSLPTAFVFNEQGKKIETIVGSVLWDSKQMIHKLKML